MLHLNLKDESWTREIEQLVNRMSKKMEKELGSATSARVLFTVSQKTRKQNHVHMALEHQGQPIYEQEYIARCWQSTLDQCVTHAIWLVRQANAPLEAKPSRAGSSRFVSY